jgi:hypothetical protein
MPDPYPTALGIASEDTYATVEDLASKALATGRITDAERNRAGNPRIQTHFSMIARAGIVDLMNVLKAAAERLDELKQEEENER